MANKEHFMLAEKHQVSIIIPTHNRKAFLRQALNALVEQTYPHEQFEVVVVVDGCMDGSLEMLQEFSSPFNLRIFDQEQKGAGAARNQGASLAKGDLLIFLDDDIETSPGFVQAHVDAHLKTNDQVVIGYYPSNPSKRKTYLSLEMQCWWELKFGAMRVPGLRFAYTDLLSGDFSLNRVIFLQMGGFDPNMVVHEDYELGARLIKAGLSFVFEEAAIGFHHEHTDINRSVQRKFQEGIADVRMGRIHPELISTLLIWRLIEFSHFPSRFLQHLEFCCPLLAKLIASTAAKMLPRLEQAHLVGLWRRVLYGVLAYWYWKGIVQELPTWKDIKNFLGDSPTSVNAAQEPELIIDLSQGLDQAEKTLDRERPDSVEITLGGHFIGRLPYQPGTERWRGEHLRPYLVEHFLFQLLEAFANQGIINLPVNIENINAFTQNDLPL